MQLFFVRHGESEANLLREISNRGQKHGLTERGRGQAAVLAARLATLPAPGGEGASLEIHLYTSPLLRAVQTAEILAASLGVAFEITPALGEFDCGIYEGRSDAEAWQMHRAIWTAWTVHKRWNEGLPEGERFVDIQNRFMPLIGRILQRGARRYAPYNPAAGGRYILVGHGGLYHCMLPLILENISFEFANQHPMSNTAYVLAEPREQGLVCLEWCDLRMEEPNV